MKTKTRKPVLQMSQQEPEENLISFQFCFVDAINNNDCVQTLLLGNGEFRSPAFPAAYPPSIDNQCIVHIQGFPGSEIVITFLLFDVEHGPSCDYDYVEVISLVLVLRKSLHVLKYFGENWSNFFLYHSSTCIQFYYLMPILPFVMPLAAVCLCVCPRLCVLGGGIFAKLNAINYQWDILMGLAVK